MRLLSSSYYLNISEITETHGNCLNDDFTEGGNGLAAVSTPPASRTGRFHRVRGFQLQPLVIVLAFRTQNRINQKKAGFGFVVSHITSQWPPLAGPMRLTTP